MKQHASTVRRLVLALLLATGMAIAWGAVVGVFWDTVHSKQRNVNDYDSYVVQVDGTPAIVTTSRTDYRNRSVRTLRGQPLKDKPQLHGWTLPGPRQLPDYILSRHWQFRVTNWRDTSTPPRHWYFLHDGERRGHAWFEGFDPVTKRRIGFIGRRGFTAGPLTPDNLFPFDARLRSAIGHMTGGAGYSFGMESGNSTSWLDSAYRIQPWMCYLVSDGALCEIDLRRRSARTLLANANLVSAAVVEQALPADANPYASPRQDIVARSPDRLWIIDPRSGSKRSLPLSSALREKDLVVYQLDEGVLLHATDRFRSAPQRFVWLDSQGNITRDSGIPPQKRDPSNDESWRAAAELVSVIPVPAALGFGAFVVEPFSNIHSGKAASYAEALRAAVARFWRFIPVTVVLAAVVGGYCYRRQRSLGQPGAVAWLVFGFLVGLPGLVAYLAHRNWPVREACPACHRIVPRDRDACLACGETFPPPSATGTEVFA